MAIPRYLANLSRKTDMEDDQRRPLALLACVVLFTKKHRWRKRIQEGILAEKTTCHVWNGKSLENPVADLSPVCSFSPIIAELL